MALIDDRLLLENCYADFSALSDLQLLQIKICGEMDGKALSEIVAASRSLADVKKYNRLCDFRECYLRMSILELYNFPRKDASMQSLNSKMVKVAILVPRNQDEEHYRFYEATAQNVGFNIRIFNCEKEAFAWTTKTPGDGC